MQAQQHEEEHEPERAMLERTAFSVVASFHDADRDDTQYWWAQSAEMRLQYLEQLRQLNYGHDATARFQRVFEVVQRP